MDVSVCFFCQHFCLRTVGFGRLWRLTYPGTCERWCGCGCTLVNTISLSPIFVLEPICSSEWVSRGGAVCRWTSSCTCGSREKIEKRACENRLIAPFGGASEFCRSADAVEPLLIVKRKRQNIYTTPSDSVETTRFPLPGAPQSNIQGLVNAGRDVVSQLGSDTVTRLHILTTPRHAIATAAASSSSVGDGHRRHNSAAALHQLHCCTQLCSILQQVTA